MPIRKPLADLIRPKDLSQFVGQKDLIKEGQPLYQIIKNLFQFRSYYGDRLEQEKQV